MLIHQIRNATSPLARVKAVALAWRTLRGLSTHERMQLARELGAEGAERLVEGLANHGDIAPASILSAIHKAETTGTHDLREALGELLYEDQAEPEPPGPPPPHPLAATHQPEPEPPAQTAAQADPAPAPSVEPVAEPAPVARPEPKDKPEDKPETDPAPVAVPVAVMRPERPSSPAGESIGATAPTATTAERPSSDRPAEPHRARPVQATVVSLPHAVPSRATQGPEPGPESPLHQRVEREPHALSRLRTLNRHLSEASSLAKDDLLWLISLFPDGWMRRRAVDALLRSRVPATTADAIDLASTMERPSDRLWVLTSVAAWPGLSGADREALLETAGSPRARRRLELRMRRGRAAL
jgi:hypothetical protein